MRVADQILEILSCHGVRQIFGVPGDAINDFTFAVSRRDDMEFILVRHEEAGAFMAAAQAKLTGRLTACMGTAGPGAVHLLNGLYDAKQDHAPVIAITGQVATEFIGTGHPQEINSEQLFGDVAEFTQTVMVPDQALKLTLEACKAALSAGGVSHICVPTDVAGKKVTKFRQDLDLGSELGQTRPCAPSLDKALDLIAKARKPAILAGIGAASAGPKVLALAERLNAPIVRTLRAKDWIDEQERLCVGGLGLLGSSTGSSVMEKCDLLILAGSDYPYVTFYPTKTSIIQIEPDPRRMGRRAPIAAPLHGHAEPTLDMLLEKVEAKPDSSFLDGILKEKDKERKAYRKPETSDATPIKPQRVMAELSEAAPDDTIFLCDVGTTTAWSARHLRVGPDQRFTLSASYASMAFALPGAIGAQLAYPDRPVVAIAGDGGFAMLMADLVTATRYELPITCVVFENNSLGFIALEQEAKGLPKHSIDLVNPDFVKFAEACGARGFRVTRPDALAATLKEAIDHPAPAVVVVEVDPDELIIPPRISAEQALNFGLAKIREVLE